MTIKIGEIVNKIMGVVLLGASLQSFSEWAAGSHLIILPALLSGAGGFWLLIRRERRALSDAQLEARLQKLESALSATQSELSAAVDRLQQLSDERDFTRQLAVPSAATPSRAEVDRP